MRDLGLMHVYYGNGKGKTTAAFGLAARARGRGARVIVVQFLKGAETGELRSMAELGVEVLRGRAGDKRAGTDPVQDAATRAIHDANLSSAAERVFAGECDLLVLDEGMDALRHGLVDEELFRKLVRKRPDGVELVITGHKPVDWVMEEADYITHMTAERHPFSRGVPAREAIEF